MTSNMLNIVSHNANGPRNIVNDLGSHVATQNQEECVPLRIFPERFKTEIPMVILDSARISLLMRIGFRFYRFCHFTRGRLTKISFCPRSHFKTTSKQS